MNNSFEFYNRKKFMISIVGLFLISCATQNETKMNQYTVGPYDMKIGFGSCLKQNKAMPIFEAIKADSFDLFLMLVDNVYGDSRTENLKELRSAYNRQQQNLS